jgi:hypothetical protein
MNKAFVASASALTASADPGGIALGWCYRILGILTNALTSEIPGSMEDNGRER